MAASVEKAISLPSVSNTPSQATEMPVATCLFVISRTSAGCWSCRRACGAASQVLANFERLLCREPANFDLRPPPRSTQVPASSEVRVGLEARKIDCLDMVFSGFVEVSVGCLPDGYMSRLTSVFGVKGRSEDRPYSADTSALSSGGIIAIGARIDEKRSIMNCVFRDGSRCDVNSIGSVMS